MACKTETKQIDDREYSVTQWSAEKSILMKFKLIKAFGAALTNMATASEAPGGDKAIVDNAKLIPESFNLIFKVSSPEDLLELLKSCIIGVACDGKRITASSFNELFSGDDLLSVYKVFIFVIQVNYSNLLKGQHAASLLARVKESL